MTKKDIYKRLEELDISKNNYIVIGDSSLVLQGIKKSTLNIEISCSEEIFDNINIPIKKDKINRDIKVNDDLIFRKDFYDLKNIINIDNYQVSNLESTYNFKVAENTDKKDLKKLRLTIDSMDNYKYERELIKSGINYIAGVDEVGRGPLVGPVVTACVVLPHNFNLDGLTDSKKLSEKKRDFYFEEIKKQALGIGIGMCSEKEIDEVNIYEATKIAMKRAIANCQESCKIEHILIDAMKLDLEIPTTSIIKGDLKSITISAASVIAKVTRDQMMYELDKKYPMYGFHENVGYPTKKHIEAINEYGILKEHRKTFGPVRDYILEHGDKTIN